MIRQDHGFSSPHEPFARATLRDKKKKERRGLRKRGVKIHPFHLPWIRAWDGFWKNLLPSSSVYKFLLSGQCIFDGSQDAFDLGYITRMNPPWWPGEGYTGTMQQATEITRQLVSSSSYLQCCENSGCVVFCCFTFVLHLCVMVLCLILLLWFLSIVSAMYVLCLCVMCSSLSNAVVLQFHS